MFNKKHLSMAAVLIIALLIPACSGGGTGANANVAESAGASSQASSQSNKNDTVVDGYPTFGLTPDSPQAFDIFFNFTWWPDTDWDGIIPEEVTRVTGVSFNVNVALDEQQMGVMIASGDLPEIVSTQYLMSELSNSELCYDWDTLINQYGLDWDIPQVAKANALSFTQEEDKYFTIMSHFASTEDWRELEDYGVGAAMTGSLLYRRDLYEAMGAPKLDTLDDIKSMLIMAHEKYPDLITMQFNPGTDFWYFKEAFGLGQGDGQYVEDADGNWHTVLKDSRYRDFLVYLNELNRAGCLSEDNLTLDGTTLAANVTDGNCFAMVHGTQGAAQAFSATLQEKVPEGLVYEAPVVGDLNGYYNCNIGYLGTFISKSCKDPEKAIRYLQFCHSEKGAKLLQWGREGQEYTVDEKGTPTFSKEWNDAVAAGQTEDIYKTYFYLGGSKILEAVGRCAAFDPAQTPNYEVLREVYGNKPWITYATPVEGSKEKVVFDKLYSGTTSHLRTYELKCVYSKTEAEFEDNYTKMIEIADQIGAVDLETFMDARIKEAMVVYGVGIGA
ncbi:MAG: extracellular solute-binding protein [Clostridiales bacterium]|jgi:putative aldouronate transport system substrate-binding protein|nr:extracellular solute-binding protein [Clostridiales bacterium]